MSIPVVIGSHYKIIELNDSQMKCKEFIHNVLIQCNLLRAAINFLDTYRLFERSNGVDRLVDSNENIFRLCSQWQKPNGCTDVVFIIKKFQVAKHVSRFIKKTQTKTERFFSQLNKAECGMQTLKIRNALALSERELRKKRKIARNNFYSLTKQIEQLESQTIKHRAYDENFLLVKNLLESSEKFMLENRLKIKMQHSNDISLEMHFYEEIKDLTTMDVNKLNDSQLPKNSIFNCFM
jgi:hypothetical protein